MTTVSIRLEEKDKRALDEICAEMGMNIGTFFSVYVKKVLRERCIPFSIEAPVDPFYSEENQRHILAAYQQIKEGKVVEKTIEELEAYELE